MIFLACEDDPEVTNSSKSKTEKNKKEPKEEIKNYGTTKKHISTRDKSNSSDDRKEKKKIKKEKKKKKDKKNKNRRNEEDESDRTETNGDDKDGSMLEFDPQDGIIIGGESQQMSSLSNISAMDQSSFKDTKNKNYGSGSIHESDISVNDISMRKNKLDMTMSICEENKHCEPKDYLPPLAYKKYNELDEYLFKKKSELLAKSDQLQFERYQILEANILHDF